MSQWFLAACGRHEILQTVATEVRRSNESRCDWEPYAAYQQSKERDAYLIEEE